MQRHISRRKIKFTNEPDVKVSFNPLMQRAPAGSKAEDSGGIALNPTTTQRRRI